MSAWRSYPWRLDSSGHALIYFYFCQGRRGCRVSPGWAAALHVWRAGGGADFIQIAERAVLQPVRTKGRYRMKLWKIAAFRGVERIEQRFVNAASRTAAVTEFFWRVMATRRPGISIPADAKILVEDLGELK